MNSNILSRKAGLLLIAASLSTAAMGEELGAGQETTAAHAEETTIVADNDVKYDMENGVLPIADDRGFTLQSKDGNFVFKPYLYLQTNLSMHYYDDEGLDKAYNQDNIANSGFAIPYAILGFR